MGRGRAVSRDRSTTVSPMRTPALAVECRAYSYHGNILFWSREKMAHACRVSTDSAHPLEAAIDRLFERPALPRFDLPAPLTASYGGGLGFDSPCLYANFVASVDGVVTLAAGGESGHIISQDSEADRFVMGLLRACADAVIVGAGTFRKAPGHLWHAAAIYPGAAPLFAETRRRLGLPARPTFVLITGSGAIDAAQPAVRDAIIVTTPAGAARLGAPQNARVLVFESNPLRLADVVARLHAEGLRVLLTEGGPSLVGALLAEKALDELFVTVSPSLFGRYPNDRRKSLADGVDLAGDSLELLSVRRHRSHAFLRYAIARKPTGGP
jgi:riboflavin biosynthesis pyrimidine reductase